MKFKVPIIWSLSSEVTVVAESREEAAGIAESMRTRPKGYYVEKSLEAMRPLIERIFPRSIENPRNHMQLDIECGDITEVEENGKYYVLPIKGLTDEDTDRETGAYFTDVWYGRLIGECEVTAYHWAESEEDLLDELEDRYGHQQAVEPFKLIQGGRKV